MRARDEFRTTFAGFLGGILGIAAAGAVIVIGIILVIWLWANVL